MTILDDVLLALGLTITGAPPAAAQKPGATIDFSREFSLPFGVPTDLTDAALADYLGQLGAEASMVYFDRPDRVALEPGFAPKVKSSRVRTLSIGADRLVVPRCAGVVPSLPAADLDLDAKRVSDSGGSWVAAGPVPGMSMAQVAARRFRWDDDAKAAAPLPQPLLTDEALTAYWPDRPALPPLPAADQPGIAEDDAAGYLLATSAGARDGELERTLLRAPAVGLVRFERYRHLVLRAGRLQVAQPSATGAWVLKAMPSGSTRSPLDEQRTVVFEHVAVEHAIECAARLVTVHLLRLADVLAASRFRPAVLGQMSWLLRSWLAWLSVVAPVVRPGTAGLAATIPATMRAPFEGTKTASRGSVEAMVAYVLADAAAKASLLDFVVSYYAPLLCGRSWSELGVDLPIEPANRPPELVKAHLALERLPFASEMWLLAFAGCPLGRPGRLYEPRTAPSPAHPRPLGRLTTFELEAVAIAGLTTAEYPDVAAPDVADPLRQVDLSGFAADSPGVLAVLRAVDKAPPRQEFTTYDWLAELVKGARRAGPQPAKLDFGNYAAHGHPLAPVLHFPQHVEAVELSARMERLGAVRLGGKPLGAATIDWWSTTTGLRDAAGDWPATVPAQADASLPPSPSTPYKSGTTLKVPPLTSYWQQDGEFAPGAPRVTGFDEVEIEAVLRAVKVVRNGKTLATDLDPALFLALLEREGFRGAASGERLAVERDVTGVFAPGVRSLGRNADHVGLMLWLIYPFGLDMVVRNKPLQNVQFDNPALVTLTRDNVRDHFLLRLTAEGLFDQSADLRVDWESALRYLGARRPAKWTPGGLRHRTASRTALWMAFAIHQATFQWVHRLLTQATTPRKSVPPAGGNPYVQVAEFLAPPPPPVGADATTAERRRYIAYWSLVYLAFNVEERTWNAWVDSVPDPVLASGTSISEYLVYHRNASPKALEPPGAGPRQRGQRGNMLRFATALDGYLRLAYGSPAEDTTDPAARAWPVV
ncbi:hypothetical protein [Tessaracoccus caeni]|uniref:hypothetical protein n=1 Tax=Tessaracoccus caeni TaxID=3031239 RepID=UPI0023DB4B5C|nr:hypothetical protein [Tessaracoccus caeni]MDF1488998.1 hypothetical protein [Tessaracoccus caeni]